MKPKEVGNRALTRELVWTCRILVQRHLDSGPFGNVSARVPGRDEYLQNPLGITFDRITFDDVLLVDREGAVIAGDHPAHPGEFIHREIYRRRPDVQAIVHTHSPETVAVSLLGKPIEPFTQVGASLAGDQGLYLGFNGPVRDSNEGAAIAEALGAGSIVIAKNHGLFAVGRSLPEALWNMVVADLAASIHVKALTLGLHQADPMPAAIKEKSRREVRDRQYEAMWRNYLGELRDAHPGLFEPGVTAPVVTSPGRRQNAPQ